MREVVITIKGSIRELSTPEDLISSVQNFLDSNEAGVFIEGAKYEVSVKPATYKKDHFIPVPEKEDAPDDEMVN